MSIILAVYTAHFSPAASPSPSVQSTTVPLALPSLRSAAAFRCCRLRKEALRVGFVLFAVSFGTRAAGGTDGVAETSAVIDDVPSSCGLRSRAVRKEALRRVGPRGRASARGALAWAVLGNTLTAACKVASEPEAGARAFASCGQSRRLWPAFPHMKHSIARLSTSSGCWKRHLLPKWQRPRCECGSRLATRGVLGRRMALPSVRRERHGQPTQDGQPRATTAALTMKKWHTSLLESGAGMLLLPELVGRSPRRRKD